MVSPSSTPAKGPDINDVKSPTSEVKKQNAAAALSGLFAGDETAAEPQASIIFKDPRGSEKQSRNRSSTSIFLYIQYRPGTPRRSARPGGTARPAPARRGPGSTGPRVRLRATSWRPRPRGPPAAPPRPSPTRRRSRPVPSRSTARPSTRPSRYRRRPRRPRARPPPPRGTGTGACRTFTV